MKTKTLFARTRSAFHSIVAVAALATIGAITPALADQGGSHFKALGPDKAQGNDDSLFYPNAFESAVAAKPDPKLLAHKEPAMRLSVLPALLCVALATGLRLRTRQPH